MYTPIRSISLYMTKIDQKARIVTFHDSTTSYIPPLPSNETWSRDQVTIALFAWMIDQLYFRQCYAAEDQTLEVIHRVFLAHFVLKFACATLGSTV